MLEKSKLLSLLLRHKPEKANLKLDKEGWISIDELLYNIMNFMNINITRDELNQIVDNNDKKRFTIKNDKIRAAQGHSVKVDINLKESIPPIVLIHGTKVDFLPLIVKKGLVKGTRNHVHLSDNPITAEKVASRRKGKNILLYIYTYNMIKDGYKFYLSDNGVWLTEYVPYKYIKHGK